MYAWVTGVHKMHEVQQGEGGCLRNIWMERLGAVGKQSICFISISYLQHSFISLLLRGAPNNSINTLNSYRQLRMKDLPKALRGARVGFEPPTLRRQGTEPTTEPPRPTTLTQ